MIMRGDCTGKLLIWNITEGCEGEDCNAGTRRIVERPWPTQIPPTRSPVPVGTGFAVVGEGAPKDLAFAPALCRTSGKVFVSPSLQPNTSADIIVWEREAALP